MTGRATKKSRKRVFWLLIPWSVSRFLVLFLVSISLLSQSSFYYYHHHNDYLKLYSTALLLSHPQNAIHAVVEKEAVQRQLGYLPLNMVRVSAWKRSLLDEDRTIPLAIQTYPLHGGTKRRQVKAVVHSQSQLISNNNNITSPFPTLWWLTCPVISRAVGDLERQGFLNVVQDRIRSEKQMATQLMKCHYDYAQFRWDSLIEFDRQLLLDAKDGSSFGRMRQILQNSGISGSNLTTTSLSCWNLLPNDHKSPSGLSEWKSKNIVTTPPIKCLHAHYAQYLSCTSTSVSWSVLVDNKPFPNQTISSNYFSSARTATTLTINPVGQMIHEALQEEYPGIWEL